MNPIYLDYNATTPVDSDVLEAMMPCLREHFGNPSSTHLFGRAAHEVIDRARSQVAATLGARDAEIVFTSGGTEASNHAIKGALFPFRGHVITSAVEHPATLKPCEYLRRLGCEVTLVPVDGTGMVNPDDVRRAITPATRLISIMHANNEVGTIQPIAALSRIARERGIVMHTDAAQSLGKIPVNVEELGVDLLSVAGHKVYAPKGVGCLYVRAGVTLEPFMHGAGHEGGRRAGTENTPYIMGLGKACEIAQANLPQAGVRLRQLRDRLHERLKAALGERVQLNGHAEQRLPNTLNVNFVGHVGAELLQRCPSIAASTGSACHEGHVRLSPVLAAMQVAPEIGKGAIRLSVGRYTTEAEVDEAADILVRSAAAR
jgi:cysteine desulfurase